MKRSTLAKKFLILIGVTAGLAGCRLNDNAIRGDVDENGNLLPIIKIVTSPPIVNNSTNLNIPVTGDNMTVVEYKYKIGVAGSTDCTDETGYSGSISSSTNITDNISGLSDGSIKLCLVGKSSDGLWQAYASATSKTWTKDTGAPSDPSTWSMSSPGNGTNSNDNTPQFSDSGIVGENGSSVRVYTDAGCTVQVGSATISGGSFTVSNISFATDGSADGAKAFYGKIIDQASNESNCTDMSLGYTLDTQAPSDPSTSSMSSPFNCTNSNDNTPQFSDSGIVGENGSSVRVYTDAGCTVQVGSATIAGGSFTINNVTFATDGSADGAKAFYGKIIDQAASESNCTDMSLGYTFDTQGPTAPTGLSLGSTPSGLTTSPTLSWTAGTDGGSGVASHQAQIHLTSDDSVIKTWATLVSGNAFS